MGKSDFGILAQICAVDPNMREKVINLLMQIKKKNPLVGIALIAVELD